MKRTISTSILLVCLFFSAKAQTYFPPLSGDEWESLSPAELGWCQENIDTLLQYAEAKNSKSLIILVDGKIAIEGYFNGHDQNAFWYWASAAKALKAVLTGIAQEEGFLNINDPVSQYLGEGWTSCSPEDEGSRSIWNQLTMTSSFNNSPLYWDCTDPVCFQCTGLAPGTQWHYHNGVYRMLHAVLESATGMNPNLYTFTRVGSKIGMSGLWSDDQLFVSNTRSMARFGLLALNNFVWNGTVVLGNQDYIQSMINTSQELNKSYGYLWWLNGKESHYLPLIPFLQDGPIIPDAPADMYAGLGANDQKVYVVPSMNMVVVRMGETAYESEPSISNFDNELWQLIQNLPCDPNATNDLSETRTQITVYPNPANGTMRLADAQSYQWVAITDLSGKSIMKVTGSELSEGFHLPAGMYILNAIHHNGSARKVKVVFF
jgi:CubicO group peptidase (beta-lactamase class C family)